MYFRKVLHGRKMCSSNKERSLKNWTAHVWQNILPGIVYKYLQEICLSIFYMLWKNSNLSNFISYEAKNLPWVSFWPNIGFSSWPPCRLGCSFSLNGTSFEVKSGVSVVIWLWLESADCRLISSATGADCKVALLLTDGQEKEGVCSETHMHAVESQSLSLVLSAAWLWIESTFIFCLARSNARFWLHNISPIIARPDTQRASGPKIGNYYFMLCSVS